MLGWIKPILGAVDAISAVITMLGGLYRDYTLRRAGRNEERVDVLTDEQAATKRANDARLRVALDGNASGVLAVDSDNRDRRDGV